MAAINFYAGEDFQIQNLSGSGLGFFGAGGFGYSVAVGSWQDTTFITNGAGTSQGPQVDNVQYLNSMSGVVGSSSSGIALTAIPNYQATLNVRFTHTSAVQTQNALVYIYDRTSINNPASGVTTAVAEIIHPSLTQVNDGSGDVTWSFLEGTGVTLSLIDSPGISGQRPNGASTSETDHDWYLAISASPDSLGSKTLYGLYVSLEYL